MIATINRRLAVLGDYRKDREGNFYIVLKSVINQPMRVIIPNIPLLEVFTMNNTLIGWISAAALMAIFGICTSAQVPPEQKPPSNPPAAAAAAPCPKLEVRTPTPRPVKDGKPVQFTATITGGDPKISPIFIWSTTAGVITSGQNTPNIEVDSTGAGADKAITASILISGFPGECTADASTTIPVAGPAKKVDEYGSVKEEDEAARLDNFFANITPGELTYILAYAGRTSPRGQANADLKRIRAYLVKAGVPSERIGTIDGGFKEEITRELWLVPEGADAPRPSPTISAKDIVYPKTLPPVKKP